MDPLRTLPSEIVLRILDFCSVSSLAHLTRLNKSWHNFIDVKNQEVIYLSKTSHPAGVHDLSFLTQSTSFARYFEGTTSFKELCRRQTVLARNWNEREPITRESVFQVGNEPIWRFRADFKRRFFLSTSQHGGLNVTDMETGNLLWRLPNDNVRPFAHLEYQDGTAVWDCSDPLNGLEVWKTDLEGLSRGVFRRTATLSHDCEIRGFQLSYDTLCVASKEGEGFVYDISQDPPVLKTHVKIENDAVGHVCQNADMVMFCLGKKGYHVHDKSSGALLGTIQPKLCKTRYHIHHPDQSPNSIVSTGSALSSLPSVDPFPPKQPNRNRLTPIEISPGPFAPSVDDEEVQLADDEWGAALMYDFLMVGISKAGRVIICQDWKPALKDPKHFEENSFLIECEPDDSAFDIGGWLSVHKNRIMFEIQDQVYVVALGDDGSVPTSGSASCSASGSASGSTSGSASRPPSYSFSTSSATQLAVPVSFMELFDDCIMATYTTLGWRRPDRHPVQYVDQGGGIFPTKTIRVLSFAPELDPRSNAEEDTEMSTQPNINEEAHAAILEIMDMLSEDGSDDSSDNDGEVDVA